MKNIISNIFPWGILTVNLLGCFIFGVIFALFNKYGLTNTSWHLLLTIGFCGGFTTFSTFANDSLQMLQSGNVVSFTLYVLTSIVVGIALIALGYLIVK
jgi:CrcB protein